MTEKDEIFIQIKGIGFTLLLDKRMKHNFISPAFLAFFNLEERQMYSLPENNIGEVNTNPVCSPFFLTMWIPSALMMYSIILGRKLEYAGITD